MISADYYQKLFSALYTHDIQSVAKAAYEILDMPIVLTDQNFTVEAKYPNAPLNDEQWDENTIGKPIALRFVKTFSEDDHFSHHAKTNKPILIDWGHYKDTPRLTAVIKDGEDIVGYFSALTTNCVVEEWHYEAAEQIAKAFSIALGTAIAGKADTGSISLYALVSGTAVTWEDIELLPYSFSACMNPPYVLVRARMKDAYELPIESYLGRQMSAMFTPSIQTIFERSLYMLIGNVSDNYRNESSFHNAQHAFKEMKAVCSFSLPFEDLTHIQDAKWQADTALQVGTAINPARRTFHFADYAAEIMLDGMVCGIRPKAMEIPLITRVKEADRINGTKYLETLKALTESHFQKKDAAEILSIHRNTLLQRLNKIESLTGYSLSDSDIQTYLSLFFLMQEYNSLCEEAHGKEKAGIARKKRAI